MATAVHSNITSVGASSCVPVISNSRSAEGFILPTPPMMPPHVDVQTPRRLCLVQRKSATGAMGAACRLRLVDASGALCPLQRLTTGCSCDAPGLGPSALRARPGFVSGEPQPRRPPGNQDPPHRRAQRVPPRASRGGRQATLSASRGLLPSLRRPSPGVAAGATAPGGEAPHPAGAPWTRRARRRGRRTVLQTVADVLDRPRPSGAHPTGVPDTRRPDLETSDDNLGRRPCACQRDHGSRVHHPHFWGKVI